MSKEQAYPFSRYCWLGEGCVRRDSLSDRCLVAHMSPSNWQEPAASNGHYPSCCHKKSSSKSPPDATNAPHAYSSAPQTNRTNKQMNSLPRQTMANTNHAHSLQRLAKQTINPTLNMITTHCQSVRIHRTLHCKTMKNKRNRSRFF